MTGQAGTAEAAAEFMSRTERNQALYEESRSHAKGGIFDVICGWILSGAGVVLMAFIVILCLSLVIPNIAGCKTYVVASGSMEPKIPVGSIVYAKETDPAQLQQGDIIVFTDPARGTTPITHRVVTNDQATGTIITKGDANASEDVDPVVYANVIGKVALHIPVVGYVASVFASTLGKVAAALIVIEAFLLTELGGRLRRRRKRA